MGVGDRALETPRILAVDPAVHQPGGALGAHGDAGVFAVAVQGGAAIRVQPHAVGVVVDHRVMIEHVAKQRLHPRASAQSVAPHRRSFAQRPSGAVQVVDQRLSHVVAGQPRKTVLVAVLDFEFPQSGRACRQTVGSAQKVFFDRYDPADLAVVNALDGLLNVRLEPAVQTRQHAESLLLGSFAGAGGHLDSGRVDGVRLLDEHVLAGLDSRCHLQRMELGRIGDQHHVSRFDDLLVGVQTNETVVVVHRRLVGPLLLQRVAAALDPVGEHVGHRHQSHAGVGVHGLCRGTGAAASTAHQTNADQIVARRVGTASQAQSRRYRRRGGSRLLQESPPGQGISVHGFGPGHEKLLVTKRGHSTF